MMFHHSSHCVGQGLPVQPLSRFEQEDLIEMVRVVKALSEEPPLNSSQRHRSGDSTLLGIGQHRSGCDRSQLSNCLVLEQLPGRESYSALGRPSDDLSREDGVAAQFKEI